MNQDILLEVSDILASFDIEEISRLINDQINTDYENDNSTEILMNHFKPLYIKYKNIVDNYPTDSDIRHESDIRFVEICNVFLDAICNKFNLEFDNDWRSSNIGNLPGVTMAMYEFFIMDFANNLYEVFVNYILRNTKNLYKTFESLKNKKDASTLINRKNLSPEMSLIISNIYDVSTWIMEQVDEDEFFNYTPVEYLPFKIIHGLYLEKIISGEFMLVINEIFRSSMVLKSDVCFKIVSNTNIGIIKDPYGSNAVSN